MPIRIENGFAGLLWIGDPHASSIRPGRRTDDYETAVLRKLAACAEICRAENLFPVIAGDLFNRAGENNVRLLNRLAAVLDQFPTRPLTLEGNHDKSQTQITELDALALLERGGHLQVATEPGIAASITGVRDLYCVPYGTEIPDSVADVEAREPLVLLTHHDLAFNGAYPGAALLKEVQGVSLAINGHMHKNLPSVTCGQTVWHNPGNISRVSVDTRDHIPRAWRLLAGSHELEGVALPFDQEVFDLTGTKAAAEALLPAATMPVSLFSSLLASDDPLDATRTDDGSVLEEDLLEAAKGARPGVLDIVRLLLNPATSVTSAAA